MNVFMIILDCFLLIFFLVCCDCYFVFILLSVECKCEVGILLFTYSLLSNVDLLEIMVFMWRF